MAEMVLVDSDVLIDFLRGYADALTFVSERSGSLSESKAFPHAETDRQPIFMRKGTCIYGRYHCFSLADKVFGSNN